MRTPPSSPVPMNATRRDIDLGVLVVHRAEAGAGDNAGGDRAFDELAAAELGSATDGGIEVFFADCFFFGR